MNERVQCIAAYLNHVYSPTEVCERFGIRRPTGYKGVRRYPAAGAPGLQAKSRAPHRCPHRLSEEVAAIRLATKRAHPHGGPRKLLPYLARRRPDLALTVADASSRFLLSCSARLSTKQVEARPIFAGLFHGYGLPEAKHTHNGAPFATPAFCSLSRLSVWWIALGLRHQRIAPGRPEQHGAHERMHRTLQAEAMRPPAHYQSAQQARCERCCRESNAERPHSEGRCRTWE